MTAKYIIIITITTTMLQVIEEPLIDLEDEKYFKNLANC